MFTTNYFECIGRKDRIPNSDDRVRAIERECVLDDGDRLIKALTAFIHGVKGGKFFDSSGFVLRPVPQYAEIDSLHLGSSK